MTNSACCDAVVPRVHLMEGPNPGVVAKLISPEKGRSTFFFLIHFLHGILKRGAFATRDFQVGDVLFVNPVVLLKNSEIQDIERAGIQEIADRVYVWRYVGDTDEIESIALVLGMGSMVNHSWSANCRVCCISMCS